MWDKGPYTPQYIIALFTACNILIHEINVLLICLKTLCLKNVQLFCILINETTIDVIQIQNVTLTLKMTANYIINSLLHDLACSVCTVKYRTSGFFVGTSLAALARSVLKNLSPIFHGTDLTLGQ